MRSLVIVKGLVEKKKTGWARKENLQNFYLNIESARSLFYRPEFRGQREFLTKSFDDLVYKVFIKSLCTRLATGCLVVVDMGQESTTILEELAEVFGYTVFYHIESTPSDYLSKYRKYCNQKYSIPRKEQIMDQINKFNEEIKDIPKIKKVNQYSDLERYWKYELKERRIPIDGSVLHVSDIHSHYRILNDEVPSPEDYSLTVFVGDYIDGPEVGGSRKIIDQILSYSEDDIVFLEGNHELRLRKYLGYLLFKSRGRKVVSEILLEEIPDEFLETTAKEFKDLLPFEAHEMLDKLNKILKDFVIYTRGDCTYICTHSGLRWLEQLSPKYIGSVIYSNKNVDRIDKAFSDSYKTQNIFSIHGHCSYPSGLDFLKYDRVVNIDVENENCINYFINEKNNKFKLCILKEE